MTTRTREFFVLPFPHSDYENTVIFLIHMDFLCITPLLINTSIFNFVTHQSVIRQHSKFSNLDLTLLHNNICFEHLADTIEVEFCVLNVERNEETGVLSKVKVELHKSVNKIFSSFIWLSCVFLTPRITN